VRPAVVLGGVVAAAVLLLAWVFWAIIPRFEADLVQGLPGPGPVTAEHFRGSAGATTGFVDLVDLVSGRRRTQVLRLDRAETVGLQWMDTERLKVCIGAARVFRHVRETSLGGAVVQVIVAPLPAAECTR